MGYAILGQCVRRLALVAIVLTALSVSFAGTVHAGGGPENVLLIVDPTSAEGLQVANHYRSARGIPENNVIFIKPGATNYAEFVDFQLAGVLGTMANRGIDDHIDYIVVAPGSPFYVDAPNLIDGNACSYPVKRLSISAAYGLSSSSDGILGGQFRSTNRNQYHSTSDKPTAFLSGTTWLNGEPSPSPNARAYHLGFMLGYTGDRGNTVDDIIDMIDRSVAADGTNPDGTFYYMETQDIRSGPRVPHFPKAISSLERLGAKAEHIEAVLPDGKHDILGIMTGLASPKIDTADMTLIPGAFADHLTSFAANFTKSSQVKMSRWIPNGASGTAGTVEEPCAMSGNPGKFPHPHMYVWYYQGASLGEALFRSQPWMPFQTLLYGDPLTQPYAHFPTVMVFGLPSGPTSGTVVLRQSVEPGAERPITGLDLYIDGVRHSRIDPAAAFVVETANLPDGYHDLSVVAYEDETVQTQGAWTDDILVDNHGRSAELTVAPMVGDLDTVFAADASASGGDVVEIRLMQSGRLLAAAHGDQAELEVSGRDIGAGSSSLSLVAEYSDGRLAISQPVSVTLQALGGVPPSTPGGGPPAVFDHFVDVYPGQPLLLDLPATDREGDVITRTVYADMAHSKIVSDGPSWLLRPSADAVGTDTFTYSATDGQSAYPPARITVRYCTEPLITEQPADLEVCPGAPAMFIVQAEGGNLRYRWFRNGFPIPGAVSDTLTFKRADYDDNDQFHAEVTSACGLLSQTVESEPAALSVVNDERCRKNIYLPFAVNQ